MVAVGAPLAGGGGDVAAVAELAGGPLVPREATPSPAPGGVIRLAAAAGRFAVLLPVERPPASLAVASVRAAAFTSWGEGNRGRWGGSMKESEGRGLA